jgi:acyl carrier protein
LKHILLIIAVQKEFKIKFNVGEIDKLADVGAMIDLINARI